MQTRWRKSSTYYDPTYCELRNARSTSPTVKCGPTLAYQSGDLVWLDALNLVKDRNIDKLDRKFYVKFKITHIVSLRKT